MNKRDIFEFCLYLTISRFKYKDRLEQMQNRYEDAQHDDTLIETTIGDFMRSMERLGLVDSASAEAGKNEHTL